MIDAVRGVLRVRRWPKKRGPPTSERQLFWIDWFKQANLLAKYADAASQVRSKEMAAGSGMYPRDVLLKAMRGRLYNWVDQDGWRWYSMAAIGDISESLDVLAQSIGSLLVRAADRWRDVAPGNLDDVLTHRGPGAPPEWLPPGGGGLTFAGALVHNLGNQSIPHATSTAVTWDAEIYDTDSIHDNAVFPTRLTVPVGWTKVRLTQGIRWTSATAANRIVWMYMNGAAFLGEPQDYRPAFLNAACAIVSPVIPVVAGDFFEAMVYQDSGIAKAVLGGAAGTYFAMERAE